MTPVVWVGVIMGWDRITFAHRVLSTGRCIDHSVNCGAHPLYSGGGLGGGQCADLGDQVSHYSPGIGHVGSPFPYHLLLTDVP